MKRETYLNSQVTHRVCKLMETARHVPQSTIRFIRIGILLTMCASGCSSGVVQHNNAGNEHFVKGAYDAANAQYRQAQLDNPDLAEPYYNAANAFYRQAQKDAALTQAQQALKTADPDLAAQTWYNLGNFYFDTENWQEAITAYQESLRISPEDRDAKHNLELALQKIAEQQQQNEAQDPQNQESNRNEQPEATEASPTPSDQKESSREQDLTTPQPPSDVQESDGMTPEQALQLIQALVDDSETLQEHLQEMFLAPGPSPEHDW